MLHVHYVFLLQKMCAIEEELETKLGVFRFQLNGESVMTFRRSISNLKLKIHFHDYHDHLDH